MATAPPAIYFEESWSILSSIGLINCLIGLMIIGITSLSHIAMVPIVCSVACAIANGMCYYAFYADYATTPRVIAGATADVAWLVQEAGLSFYSYLILVRVLRRKDRIIFMCLFWSLIGILFGIRIAILVTRCKQVLDGTNRLQKLVNHLHIGYFSSIALVEIISSTFLLRKFDSARKTQIEAASKSGIFRYLMRSTEIRLATLALIGITRAVTYSFQTAAQSATGVVSQIDRFVYSMECLFPMVMFVDILASKLAVANHIHNSNSNTYAKSGSNKRRTVTGNHRDIALYSVNAVETRVDANPKSSSQEHIVDRTMTGRGEGGASGASSEIDRKGISKTVEFDFVVESADDR